MMYPHRVAKALCVLTGEWKTFVELFGFDFSPGALEAKQLTGTLVALRNKGVVQSRKRVHKDQGTEVTEWRLHPLLSGKFDEQFVSVRAAAQALGVHENTVRNWTEDGTIRDVRRLPGSGYRRIPASEIERLKGSK